MKIDLNNYIVHNYWVEDDRNFNFINKWICKKTNKILKTEKFKPINLIIKIYPKVPFETRFKIEQKESNLLNKNKKTTIKEEQVIFEPFKYEFKVKENKYINKIKFVDKDNPDVEIIKYDILYHDMLFDAKLKIEEDFENSSDIIKILYNNNFNILG